MITFKEFLQEVWHSMLEKTPGVYNGGALHNTDIFKNPSHKEMHEITYKIDKTRLWSDVDHDVHHTRAIVHGNDIYAWHPEKAMHFNVAKHLKSTGILKDNTYKEIILDHKRKTFTGANGRSSSLDHQELEKHPWLKKHGYKFDINMAT